MLFLQKMRISNWILTTGNFAARWVAVGGLEFDDSFRNLETFLYLACLK